MKVMILAAGLGTRMRPLTDHTPKPLLPVGGKPLIVWHIEKLARAGYQDIVINMGWLGDQLPATLGDGSRWGVHLHYSDEQAEGILDTAGGIIKALPLLGTEPFLVINGDVWCDYACLPHILATRTLAHLLLVPNPPHHPTGDFALLDGRAQNETGTNTSRYTFSGMGYYHPQLFAGLPYGKQPLAPLLRNAMQDGLVSAELYEGKWLDIGTPERLRALDLHLSTERPQVH